VVEQVTEFLLAHDEKWEKRLTFALYNPGTDQRINFLLYREGLEEPYRSLHLWVDVGAVATTEATQTPSALRAPTASPTTGASPTATLVEAAPETPTASPVPTEAPTATPASLVIHVVQPGETLTSIGGQYGVAYQAIMEANGLSDPILEVGQELIIPQPE
jgi:LysM repeat protein